MRAYQIILTDTNTGKVVKTWESHPKGKFDPGALLIEFDAIVSPYSTPVEGQGVTVHGISLQDMNQAQEFTGLQLALYGGMQTGLPLASPTQYGLLMSGVVWQSWGTWEGTEMKLDFILQADQFYIGNPGNLVLNWPANTPLATPLKNMLQTAYPKIPVTMNIADIVQSTVEVKKASSLSGFSPWLAQVTKALGHAVQIVIQSGKFLVFDDTYLPKPIQILFSDLIGQPTWIEPNIMQIKVILRADIIVGSQILMPKGLQNAPGQVVTSGQSLPSSLKYKSTFQGVFSVVQMRHIGNYKSHDGGAWASIINCTPESPNG